MPLWVSIGEKGENINEINNNMYFSGKINNNIYFSGKAIPNSYFIKGGLGRTI